MLSVEHAALPRANRQSDAVPRVLRARQASYRLDSVLTRTAHATLYLGHSLHCPEQQQLVLKQLPRTRLARREADIHRLLQPSSPFCVPLLDHVTTHDHIYLVMPYYRHGDLFDLIMAVHQDDSIDGLTKEQWALDVFAQLLTATKTLHSQGIYHRDLKPENVFLSENGEIRIGDFGLATTDPFDDALGFGSEFYMSPESFDMLDTEDAKYLDDESYPLPAKSDIWSLGVLLLNLLCGRNPWSRAQAHTDAAFADYLANPYALRDAFGLTEEAFYVVSRMLCPNVEMRADVDEIDALTRKVPYWLVKNADERMWEETAAEALYSVSEDYYLAEHQDKEKNVETFAEKNALVLPTNTYALHDRCNDDVYLVETNNLPVPMSPMHDQTSCDWITELNDLRLALNECETGDGARDLDYDEEDTVTLLTDNHTHEDDDEDDNALTDHDEEPITPTVATFKQVFNTQTDAKSRLLEPEDEDAMLEQWMMLEFGGCGAQYSTQAQLAIKEGRTPRRSRRGSLADILNDVYPAHLRYAEDMQYTSRPATASLWRKPVFERAHQNASPTEPWQHALIYGVNRDGDDDNHTTTNDVHFATALAF